MTLESEAQIKAWLTADIGCDAVSLSRLGHLVDLLSEENARQNLVSQASLGDVWHRHIADSAQLLLHLPRETPHPSWIDLGTGAGFPGLVIAMCRPQIPVVLVESRAKRSGWLNRVTEQLKLQNITVEGRRLESIPTQPFSIISARAFAPLSQLIALASRFSTPQTLWLLPKGRGAEKEVADMPSMVREMFHVEQSLTDPNSAILVGRGHPQLPRAFR